MTDYTELADTIVNDLVLSLLIDEISTRLMEHYFPSELDDMSKLEFTIGNEYIRSILLEVSDINLHKDSASSLYGLSRRIADEYIKLNNNKIKQVSDIKDEQTLFVYDNFKFENGLNNSVKVFLNNIHVGNRLSKFYINDFKNYLKI
jgi:hypothetical protein